jgi:hypothetical protein
MAVAVLTFIVWAGAAYAAQSDSGPSPQINQGGGVVVKVTPRPLPPAAEAWEFEVVFETHTGALSGDPAQFSALIDAQGRTHSPLRWEGDPPGGHHRKGVLRFKPPPGRVGRIELRIDGVGGVPTRVFRWQVP